jgi:hypothetical protein
MFVLGWIASVLVMLALVVCRWFSPKKLSARKFVSRVLSLEFCFRVILRIAFGV